MTDLAFDTGTNKWLPLLGTAFDKMADVTGASVPAAQDYVTVSRRDASSLPAPYIMRDAGLSDPGHSLKAQLADNRWFEYAPDKVIDITSIGAGPDRSGAENTAFFLEAVAYSVLRNNVPIFWPAGIFEHEGLQQLNTAVAIIGAGQESTILRAADASAAGTIHFQGTLGTDQPIEDCRLCGLTVDGNAAGRIGITSHGVRGQNLKRCLIRDVTVKDTPNYGIGFEAGVFIDVLFDNITIIRSGADGFDMKDNESGNRHVTFSNITVYEPNQGDNIDEAGVDIRSKATLSNIAVYGPLKNNCVGIRFRAGIVDVVDDRPYAGEKSSLNNFLVWDPGSLTDSCGVQVLAQNVNLSNGNIYGCKNGLWITGGAVNTSISNVQSIEAVVNGLIIDGKESRLFGVRAIDAGDTGMTLGATAAGNHFFGCESIGSAVRDLFIETPSISVDLATTGNITLSGEQTIDGTLTAGSRIAVVGQTDKKQNGIYVSAAGAWARASDANTTAKMLTYAARVTSGINGTGRWYRFIVPYEDWNLTIGNCLIRAYQAGENRFFGGTFPLGIRGTSQSYGVTGFRNEMRGSSTIAIGAQQIQIFHHMGIVPTQIIVSPITPLGAVGAWWVDNINNQSFLLHVDAIATVAVDFAWEAYFQ